MLTQFLATMLLLVGVLIGAAGAHWRRIGGPPALVKFRHETCAYFVAFAEVWERDVRTPMEHQYRRLGVQARTWHDQLVDWSSRLPEPKPVLIPAPVIAPILKPDYAGFSVRIAIGAKKSILVPAAIHSHRFVRGATESFEEWRLRTWASDLHAASVELIREKANATVSSVEVLYGRLTESAEAARFPVGAL